MQFAAVAISLSCQLIVIKFHIRYLYVVTFGIFLYQIHQCHIATSSRYGGFDQCGRAPAPHGGLGEAVSNNGLNVGRVCHCGY